MVIYFIFFADVVQIHIVGVKREMIGLFILISIITMQVLEQMCMPMDSIIDLIVNSRKISN